MFESCREHHFTGLSFSGRTAGCLPVDEGSIPFRPANRLGAEFEWQNARFVPEKLPVQARLCPPS
jgi:hypothetical protein